jgi:hypothetical protein
LLSKQTGRLNDCFSISVGEKQSGSNYLSCHHLLKSEVYSVSVVLGFVGLGPPNAADCPL